MEIGLIEWFNDSKGFGILKTPDNREVFLHISNWKGSVPFASNNSIPIFFEIGIQRNKYSALNCTYFNHNNQEHWEKIFSLSEYSYSIKINHTQKNILIVVLSETDTDFDFTLIRRFFRNIIDDLTKDALFNRNELIYNVYKNITNKQAKSIILELIFSKVNKLNDKEILKFWGENIIREFVPDQNILIKCYKEISFLYLKKIENTEVRNLIILRKLNDLKREFNPIEFSKFNNALDLIDSNKLKNKIVADLNIIAKTNYLSFLTDDIIKLTQETDITCYSLENFLKEQPSFLSNDFLEKFATILKNKIVENCSFRTITDCWKKNFIKELDDSVLFRVKDQQKDDLIHFLNCEKCNESIAKPILDKFLEDQEFSLLLEQAKYFSPKLFDKYDRLVRESTTEQQYFDLWKNKKAYITPLNYISEYLNHQEERYLELQKWLKDGIISKEEVIKLLTTCIKRTTKISDRYEFYCVFNAVKNLINIEPNFQEIISPVENDFISLILWHLKKKNEFDFETLKGKFIYFKPDDQVYIFKRLFYLKHQGQIEFDINKLDEIIRADIELYLLNEKFNDDFVLDISTHVIIESLKSFIETKTFEFESDLILKDLQKNSKRKFKIEKYFDLCEGRLTANWDWETNGTISKTKIVSNRRNYEFFKVEFEYDQNIVEDLKKLPRNKRKYYPDKKYWGVSLSCKEDLFELARKHKLFIELGNNQHYENNMHLVEFTREVKTGSSIKNIPNGITFCEGRKAKKKHNKFKKEFWWCNNKECFQNCVRDHLSVKTNPDNEKDIWEEYTLFDFLKILKINFDEYNGIDLIKDGHYYKFLGHINAFNRLLGHMYCEECGNLLYPVKSSHFALYRNVRFHCIEKSCSQRHKEIYLNHCLNGECKTIIDSRVSQRCEHGLYICPNCGTCCSEEFFKRRLESLKNVGGYIHPELIENVKKQNGHLEKKEYYCYKCSGMMTEINLNKYECSKCGVTYNLEKFEWLHRKWTHVDRRRKDYPVYSRNNDNDINDGTYPF